VKFLEIFGYFFLEKLEKKWGKSGGKVVRKVEENQGQRCPKKWGKKWGIFS